VCDAEHFAECIKARPSNREKLMQTDVHEFIAVMTTWRETFLQSSELPIAGATEQDLKAMTAPACIIAGNDVIHSPITARKAAALIPGAVLHENVVEKLPDDRLRQEWDRKEWRNAEPRIATIFSGFLARTERAPRVA